MAQHTHRMHGVIKNIGECYGDSSQADIEVEEPANEKQRSEHKKNKFPGEVRGTRHSHRMPKADAEGFALGDHVELEQTIRHFGKKPAGKTTSSKDSERNAEKA